MRMTFDVVLCNLLAEKLSGFLSAQSSMFIGSIPGVKKN
jgi:hypothetical protein